MLLGGRVEYTGKDIHAAHALAREQGLNDGHFDWFLKPFREELKQVGVDADKVERVTNLLETRRNPVLNPCDFIPGWRLCVRVPLSPEDPNISSNITSRVPVVGSEQPQ